MIEREYEIMNVLKKYNLIFLKVDQDELVVFVFEVYCLCEDINILGIVFYVMKFIEGCIFID